MTSLALPAPVRRVHDAVRHKAAVQLRERVAGEDATRRADGIWGKTGDRWFTPDDPIWRVHLDASMFVAGIRALLLQSLHPLAMAGVDEHSSYRDDPWGRLQQTSNFISTTTFGTIPDAQRLLARVRGIHRRVHGSFEGVEYRADDPRLLAWVHVAETDSFLTCYRAFGGGTLTDSEADRYVAQIGSVSTQLGFDGAPTTVAGLREVLASYRPELRSTPAARAALHFILWEPPLTPSARPGYLSLVAGAVGTLPAYARRMLGIRTPPGSAALLRGAGNVGAAGVRWMLSDPQVQKDRRVNQATDASRHR
ncbi:oxygenase MpaB family protein [Flexivirga alba]|uniref:Oxygenase MpaB family protein n=1 Tax=Flexivirga alba TaxID=702742 RepID=A0ABW2AHD9_9MICO